MELSPPPSGLEAEHQTLFNTDCLLFLQELISTFDEEVDQVGQLKKILSLNEHRVFFNFLLLFFS